MDVIHVSAGDVVRVLPGLELRSMGLLGCSLQDEKNYLVEEVDTSKPKETPKVDGVTDEYVAQCQALRDCMPEETRLVFAKSAMAEFSATGCANSALDMTAVGMSAYLATFGPNPTV